MIFQEPLYLLLFLLLPPALALSWVTAGKKKKLLHHFTGELAHLTAHLSPEKKIVRRVLRVLAFCLLVPALARPQWGEMSVTLKQKGTDLVFAIDCSRSMLAKDLKPDRIQTARQKARFLLSKLVADRVALIGFAGGSAVLCPLTTDYSAMTMLMDGCSPGEIRPPGTNIASAIAKARALFGNSGEGYRNLLIFTDGEDHGRAFEEEVDRAKKDGIRVFVLITAGQDGSPIPLVNNRGEIEGYQKDQDGNPVMSKTDWQKMEQLVTRTDGRFIMATPSNEDMLELLEEIRQLEKRELKNTIRTRRMDRFHWLIWPAFFIMLVEFLLGERKNAWI
ncbi:MAG: VWA domain-containing protein [Candidatus Wallbacteria bacterium]|nr:VWA domain-containing protein [Candidatus Wallbacteria bacterium]